MEAEKLITMSLGKIATSRCQRGGINLHRNLLVASVLHKARTVYMMDAYQHIISSRKQKKESEETQQIVQTPDSECEKSVEESQAVTGSAMTHTEPISHADDKENSPPLTTIISLDKGSVQDENQGVDYDITANSSEGGMQTGVAECNKLTTNNSVVNSETSSEKMDSPLRESSVSNTINNRPCALTCFTGKRRRSHTGNNESSEITNDPIIDSPKKAKLDIPSIDEFSSDSEEKENVENNSDNFCDENVASVRDSAVTCKVSKNCDNSEPMQTEQITTLVTIFNTGFNGLCSRNSNSSDSSLNGQSQNLSCATELIHESVQIPSGIALTV